MQHHGLRPVHDLEVCLRHDMRSAVTHFEPTCSSIMAYRQSTVTGMCLRHHMRRRPSYPRREIAPPRLPVSRPGSMHAGGQVLLVERRFQLGLQECRRRGGWLRHRLLKGAQLGTAHTLYKRITHMIRRPTQPTAGVHPMFSEAPLLRRSPILYRNTSFFQEMLKAQPMA